MFAIATDVETVEFNQDFLSQGQVAVETALCNADDESTSSVLNRHLVIDVAGDVVAGYNTFDLSRLLHLRIVTVFDDRFVGALQLFNGDEVALLQILIAEMLLGILVHGVCPITVVAVHA